MFKVTKDQALIRRRAECGESDQSLFFLSLHKLGFSQMMSHIHVYGLAASIFILCKQYLLYGEISRTLKIRHMMGC